MALENIYKLRELLLYKKIKMELPQYNGELDD